MRIAIIGAGIGGLTLAHALKDRAEVSVFEKGRGPGGRMSTRRDGRFRFDHGAQCFTARTERFSRFLEPFAARGMVAEWAGKALNLEDGRVLGPRVWAERHMVAVPAMNALPRALAEGLDVRDGVTVAPIRADGGGWRLADETAEELGRFDRVVAASVPSQIERLFGEIEGEHPRFQRRAAKPCHALMVGIEGPWSEDWIAAKPLTGPIKWISADCTKPGRDRGVTTLVAHTRSGWSRRHLDTPAALLAPVLAEALARALPMTLGTPETVVAHRWGSALVGKAARQGPWWDGARGLGATGDWAATSRIEDVCLAALDLAASMGLEK
ncbi:NAD(P)/FAD-dependent oxidoreductase [Pelagibacterium montanilacus]|uniref:NAD(P)/FAD-dependent oxidoreductase n=1 Tax=Pelagibacterium montanilacus TaxID=2185280 RepID=UPI000F8C3698|nr:NAD(P)-binding protein [Pelagibacterium montanilacus]